MGKGVQMTPKKRIELEEPSPFPHDGDYICVTRIEGFVEMKRQQVIRNRREYECTADDGIAMLCGYVCNKCEYGRKKNEPA